TQNLARVVSGREMILWVVPARHLREVMAAAGPFLLPGARLVIATKGIEPDTGLRMSEVVQECLGGSPRRIAALSGPSFAREVARGDPTAGVLACRDPREGEALQEDLSYGPFRFYTNPDLVGVEMGGALKNVIALAAGVVEGIGFGSNTSAALVTRGLTEITRLGVTCGGSPSTFAGLAGLGDLVLTCTGRLSRNRWVGVQLGEGKKLEEILAGMKMVAEGIPTTAAAMLLGRRHGVELPIIEQVDRILRGEVQPRDAVAALLRRPLKGEDAWG
ncbi:MAG TPA: NAD(P)H-dependent glycerol-3-phosphate dehydrogenase, partial [Candidatus Polarisedimenticolia bacterium]|nr:NAD(P)H-dependent glycerol-3-phosphate dehydrogenase [Candidatus Polarisedimenticolia bacterium]